jgi:hypothetical protein
MSALGLVAAGKRNIREGFAYDKYFPRPKVKDEIVKRDGTVRDTVKLMDKIVRSTLSDTSHLAPLLKGKTVRETCENIWNFLYNHVQYRLDKPGLEELRRPSRSWFDRKAGVDCDDFAIMASSLLLNSGIPHKFRVTKYNADWQHVYVTVPISSNKEYIIDCVLDTFDYEKPYTDKFDLNMSALNGLGIPIAYLSGFGEADDNLNLSSLLGLDESGLLGIISGADMEINFEGLGAIGFTGKDLQKAALDKILAHLISTRNYIMHNPNSVLTSGGVHANLKMLNYAIDNWNTPNRDAALSILEKEESKWNKLSGAVEGGDEDISGIGLGKISLKKMWSGVKKAVTAVKNVAVKVGKTVVKAASNAGKAIAKGVSKLIKKVAEYNPLSIAARAGFLAAMRINMFQFAKKIAPAFMTLSEAKSKGIKEAAWNLAVKALAKAKHVYIKVLYGNEGKLLSAIKKGAGLNGIGFIEELNGLGEPVMLSVIAAATPLLAVAEALSGPDEGILGCCIHGFGDADVDIKPQAGEKKEGLIKRFIGLVKKWFSKKKGEGQDYTTQQTTSADADAGTEPAGTQPGNEIVPSESGGGSNPYARMAESGSGGGNSSGGGFSKITQWVKDNPGKTAIGGAGLAVIGYLIFKPKEKTTRPNLSGLKMVRANHNSPKSITLK